VKPRTGDGADAGEWRYFEATLPGIAANLALDEALLIESDEQGMAPALRIWESDEHPVVLGASGRYRDDVRADACLADGVTIARRSSGGGTVVVGPGALNVTVVLATAAAPGLGAVDTAQAYVLDRVARAVRECGPAAERLGSGDLTLDRRKFAGSAQRRLRTHFLVHVTILYEFPLGLIDRYTQLPRRQPAYRQNRPHQEFVVNLGLPRATLVAAIQRAWLPLGRPIHSTAPQLDLVAQLVRTKFALPEWIERL
jgi:lipoate-protein ligase A